MTNALLPVPMRTVTTPEGTQEEPNPDSCERCGSNPAEVMHKIEGGKKVYYYLSVCYGYSGKLCDGCMGKSYDERLKLRSYGYTVSMDGPIPSDTPSHRIENLRWINYSDDERRIMAAERLIAMLRERKAQRPVTTSLPIKTVVETYPGGRREERQEVVRQNCSHCHQQPAAITEKEVNGQKVYVYKDHGLWWMPEDKRYLPRCDGCARRIDDEHNAMVDRNGGYGGHR